MTQVLDGFYNWTLSQGMLIPSRNLKSKTEKNRERKGRRKKEKKKNKIFHKLEII